ncbi:MAG: 2'-5' RNA ligase family protein [Chloracidobacterium sp.]|nr:2'-5' RNA ligase family protein [Chloracidobacterium sp.]
MKGSRRQATLFLQRPSWVNRLRIDLNPAQAKLIDAHVTLCREDEVSDWSELGHRLKDLRSQVVTLEFGPPHRDGDLVYIPCVGSTDAFDDLRNMLLGSASAKPRKHNPHITLIHPRNGVCSDADFASIISVFEPFSYTFDEVAFIQQENGGIWETVETFRLNEGANPNVIDG